LKTVADEAVTANKEAAKAKSELAKHDIDLDVAKGDVERLQAEFDAANAPAEPPAEAPAEPPAEG